MSFSNEMLAETRKMIGVELRRGQPYLDEAGRDAIRHYAEAIGDTNPLWTNEEYAKKTRWKGIIAPPTILFCFDRFLNAYSPGFAGIHGYFSGASFEFILPIRLNDRITSKSCVSDIVEKETKFAKRAFFQYFDHIFTNQNGETPAKARRWTIRTERGTTKEVGKYKSLELHKYSAEELEQIKSAYESEEIRGAEPRYWEDVEVGQELRPIVKGPLTVTDMVCYYMGAAGGFLLGANKFWYDYLRKHPKLAVPNKYGVPDNPERVHWEWELSAELGHPAPFDMGPQRVAWLGQLITNWIGDDGFMKTLYAEIRRFNYVGDTTWCRGKVTKKFVAGDEHIIEFEMLAEDQRGQVTAKGNASAILPSK